MLEQFLSRVSYSSYEDFTQSFRINVPERFNFAYDVVDRIARESPDKPALVWCDDKGGEARFSFAELAERSSRVANFFLSLGIGRGDPVMLILQRRYEYWFCLLGLHKIGAIAIPATHLLTRKDIVYRNNAASVKAIVCVDAKGICGDVTVDFSGSEGGVDSVGLGAGLAAPILGAVVRGTNLVKLENLALVVKNKEALYKGHEQAVVKTL